VSARGVARQYALALFTVAARAKSEQSVGRELDAFAELVDSHDELRAALSSGAIPRADKRALVTALAGRVGLSGEVARLVELLADNGRLPLLADIAREYRRRAMEADGRVTAELVTALPIDDARRDALAAALGQATGRQVEVTGRVDPAMIGGAVARVGSVVYDGSVASQLERMRRGLVADA
jgi:F-type H+-transporting ATPase subunit delta